MTTRYVIFAVFALAAPALASSWNNLNCPAPRAPDNGLSFIFRNGELVHFRCHPGYRMRGTAVAYCVNNVWTNAAPACVPIRKLANSTVSPNRRPEQWQQRQLFHWGSPTVYGDGPRRLPLINGIWPPPEQVLALGTPKILVKEEVDIAELRHRQLEELKQQRFRKGKRRQGRKKNSRKNSVLIDPSRETVLSLGATEDGEALSVALAKHRHHKKKVTSRKSRVNTGGSVAELRRRPVAQVDLDASCVETIFRRQVPMIAPQMPNAFVYRYETKRNQLDPFNKYMEVKYKCLRGFAFATSAQTLYCKNASWIGETPRCIAAQV